MNRWMRVTASLFLATLVIGFALAQSAEERMAAAERWIDEEFSISAISREEQMEEMAWFVEACEPFQGMQIASTAENITTHVYESDVLAQAFEEICEIGRAHV